MRSAHAMATALVVIFTMQGITRAQDKAEQAFHCAKALKCKGFADCKAVAAPYVCENGTVTESCALELESLAENRIYVYYKGSNVSISLEILDDLAVLVRSQGKY